MQGFGSSPLPPSSPSCFNDPPSPPLDAAEGVTHTLEFRDRDELYNTVQQVTGGGGTAAATAAWFSSKA